MRSPVLDYKEENGLVLCQDLEGAKNEAEKLYLSEIQDLNAHAVLFRRYYSDGDKNPHYSEPAVCIFNSDQVPFNSTQHSKIHAALWSEGKCEIYIIREESRLDIFNARRPAEVKKKNGQKVSNLDSLRLDSNLIGEIKEDNYSAYKFGNGTFWEQSEFQDLLDEKDSPHIHLLEYLMAVRKKFLAKEELKLKAATIDKLLVVSILVKFLEEIKDLGDDFHTLKEIYKENNVDSFEQAVNASCTLNIFNALSKEFNGKIFDKFDKSEKKAIDQADLNLLAEFLRADIDLNTKQLFLWEQYSFGHLPPEVISSIYENFIQAEAKRNQGKREKGVVYTPIHLVNFLVNDAMPLNKAKDFFKDEKFKILDPACGSGVFLVAAYKRLLQWWAINNSSNGQIRYPDSNTAQRILEENIFGVDVKETAILVTIFSLTTTLLDKLTPKEIWGKLQLKDLSKKNINRCNFFEWAQKNQNRNYDLVIGNPPFNLETTKEQDEVLHPSILEELDFQSSTIPQTSFALHFFEAAMSLAKRGCIILPSSTLLYNNSNKAQSYREKIFTEFTVSDIYDFTHLRRNLFHKSADTPVLALLAKNERSNKDPIKHTVVKRMVTSEKKIRFEIDHYDRIKVPWQWATDQAKRFVWKTNLLGGKRLFHLINRLSMLPSLQDYINDKNDWKHGRGYEGKKELTLRNKDEIVAINERGKPEINLNVDIKGNNFKDDSMYKPPFLLIEQILGDESLSTCFVPTENNYTKKSELYYNRNFIGISVPRQDEKELFSINMTITNQKKSDYLNCQLYALSVSSNCLVQHETAVRIKDVLSLPYPQKNKYLQLSEEEKIIQNDVLNYYVHLGKAISENSDGRILHEDASYNQLKDYGNVLCETLNTIYAKGNKSWQLGGLYKTSHSVICKIAFGRRGKMNHEYVKDLDEKTNSLLKNYYSNPGAVYNRIIRIYDHQDGFDCVYFKKPPALRYWLKSIALQDADETFADLRTEGF